MTFSELKSRNFFVDLQDLVENIGSLLLFFMIPSVIVRPIYTTIFYIIVLFLYNLIKFPIMIKSRKYNSVEKNYYMGINLLIVLIVCIFFAYIKLFVLS